MAESALCVSCGAARTGPFCAACGQRVREHRLTLWRVAQDAFQHVTSFDKGFGRTIWDLLRRPAEVAQGYWQGRTVAYAAPVRFFLVAVTVVQVGVFALGLAPEFMDSFAEGWNEARRSDAEVVDGSSLVSRVQRFWVIGLAGLVPAMTFWSRITFRRARRTLAEHAVAHLYFLGLLVLGLGLSSIGGALIDGHVLSEIVYGYEAVTFFGALVLYVWSVGRTFGATLWTGLAGGLLTAFLGFAGYIAVVGFVLGVVNAHGG